MAFAQPHDQQRTGRTGRRVMVIWAIATVLLTTTAGLTDDMPTLLALPLEMVDTSGGARPNMQEDRLAPLTEYLSRQLSAHGLYAIIDPTPIDIEIDRARATQPLDRCNGCERDLARLVHADRVLIGGGDTDEAWQHAVRFFVRDLEETAVQQR
jgi:hypothetical protein